MAYVEPAVWYQQIATFYLAAGALITDPDGRILLVKPNYRAGWTEPGGILEADERPEAACAREVYEEVGLTVRPGRLLVVGWVPAAGDRPRPFVSFVFDCGTVAADTPIRLQTEELDDYGYFEPDEAVRRLPAHAVDRLAAAIEARRGGATVYLPTHHR